MLITLAAFIAGSFCASLHMEWWVGTLRVPGIALGQEFGWSAALSCQLAVLLALSELLRRWGRPADLSPGRPTWQRLLTGRWPFVWGGGGAGGAELAVAGRRRLSLVDHLGVHTDRCKNRKGCRLGSGRGLVLDRRLHRAGARQSNTDRRYVRHGCGYRSRRADRRRACRRVSRRPFVSRCASSSLPRWPVPGSVSSCVRPSGSPTRPHKRQSIRRRG